LREFFERRAAMSAVRVIVRLWAGHFRIR